MSNITDRYISMSNALIRAGHGLSLSEKRLVAIAISSLDSKRIPAQGEKPVTRISASDYAETYDIDTNTAYEQLQEGAKNLFKRSITFYEPAFKRNGKPAAPTITTMRWVGRCTYHAGEGWVELAWWQELMRHLVGLKAQFTTYQLKQATALRRACSWKLLELLMRFKSTGWAEYDIEDFCLAMGATEKQRGNFAKIRTKIIEPAVLELKQKDGWDITWSPLRSGTRKVTGLRFEFKRSPQQQLDLT